jgi:hypothetical protein
MPSGSNIRLPMTTSAPHFDWCKELHEVVGIVLAIGIEGDDEVCSET